MLETSVEDCGPIINLGVVDGQVRGGAAQGVGAVMDYLIPTAMEIPSIEIKHMETLTNAVAIARGVETLGNWKSGSDPNFPLPY